MLLIAVVGGILLTLIRSNARAAERRDGDPCVRAVPTPTVGERPGMTAVPTVPA
jgi:hypothetical protein